MHIFKLKELNEYFSRLSEYLFQVIVEFVSYK